MSHPPTATDDQQVRDCFLYLRKSKGRAGIARQRRESQATAERLRWRIVGEFIDTDSTAFTNIDADKKSSRDDYQKMLLALQSAEHKPPPGVLAWHADRLHRDTEEVKVFIRVCSRGHHPVETAKSGGYDLTTATGRKRLQQDALDAEFEVDHLRERVLTQKAEAAGEGRWLGGKVPWGWRLQRVSVDDEDGGDARILVLHPERAAAIAWGSEAVLSGMTLAAVARAWSDRGLTRFYGGEWKPGVVRAILLRARNAGLYVYRGEVVEGTSGNWPAIVSEEIWTAVVRTLQDPARRTTPGPEPRWLGSGLYLCGVCDGPLRGGAKSGGNGQKPIYRCRIRRDGGPHITRDAASLDRYVEETLLARLRRSDITDLIAEEEPPDLDEIRTRLAVQQTELADWRRLAREGKVSAIAFAENESAVLARLKEIREELVAAFRSPLLADIVSAGDIAAYWKERDLAWKRAVLSKLVTVKVHHPVRKGRPAGWRPGTPYLDTDAVTFDWRTPSG